MAPVYTIDEALAETVKWYKAYQQNQDMYKICCQCLAHYTARAQELGLSWATNNQVMPMKFQETNLQGAWLISLDKAMDERGFFARTFCQNEFRDHGLAASFVQCNLSHNYKRGTLRGMHFQISPHQEAKLVQCTHGAIYDVIIDLRPTSPTYLAYIIASFLRRMITICSMCLKALPTVLSPWKMRRVFFIKCLRFMLLQLPEA